MTPMEELQARSELKQLVDYYAVESDKDNQDAYVHVFTSDCHVRVYFNNELGMEFHNLQDLITAYKGFGAAKEAFHINGQQTVEFKDASHATGIAYGLAHLVNEEDGQKTLTTHAVRYYDSYEKRDGKWLITSREQYFVFSKTETI